MAPDISKIREKALPFLTKAAHLSAPFITTFMLVHLAAPTMANSGGSSLASQTMLLGREYYQTTVTEPFLVLLPISIHALSASLKRLLSPSPRTSPRRLATLLSLTGYSTFLFLFPIHFLTHRDYPTLATPPIYEVGPAELDYEFVKLGLREWPVRSWLMYGGLVLAATLHAVDGMTVIWNSWLGAGWSLKRAARIRRRALARTPYDAERFEQSV